jgi:50S ribosomal subunit-associated GTPase HflX
MLDVFNKCDRLVAGERARLAATHPGALCVSALRGEGRDELIAAIESRLALDTVRVTFAFEAPDESGRAEIAQLYRLGRILRHAATDGRVTIEAEIPRRLLARFHGDGTRVTA